MSLILAQNTAVDVPVVLTDSDSSPVTGLTSTDLSVTYRKEGEASFTAKVLDPADVVELGSGVYTIQFAAAELDTVGIFVFTVNGASISQYVGISQVAAAADVGAPAVTVETCVLTGHVFSISGKPIKNASVMARVLGVPSLAGLVGYSSNTTATTTDATGFFTLEVARGVHIDLMIPEINYRRQLVVPNTASANIFTEID